MFGTFGIPELILFGLVVVLPVGIWLICRRGTKRSKR